MEITVMALLITFSTKRRWFWIFWRDGKSNPQEKRKF